MITATELQQKLKALHHYNGNIDGSFGPASKLATFNALTDGTDDKLTTEQVQYAAQKLSIVPAKIWAVWDVEASANPFIDGRPTILFEPHKFSRATNHKYDSSHPSISSKHWNRSLYPKTQKARWDQMLNAMSLDTAAGLASASYGGFQILGENYKACNYYNEWDFVYSQSRNENNQLVAFVSFVKFNNLHKALEEGDWAAFARGYNGSAYKENKYDEKLVIAFKRRNK